MTRYAWPPDDEFWTGHFPAQTKDRTAPYLFKGVVPAAAARPGHVLDGFAALRSAHAAGTAISAKARVYVGEERRDDLLPTVLDAPAWEEVGGFTAWMQDLTGADRFSLVVNNLETLSPPLAAGLGRFLGALITGWGLPLGGAEQVAFAGNYSGTAFGVHEGYEDAFLIHLGPNPKNFYTWPAETYTKLTGGPEPLYGDYTWLLEHGTHWLLEPGDALFLPRRVFHVGTQNRFSVSVAVPLYTYPDAGIVRQAVLPDLLAGLLTGEGPDAALSAPSPMASVPGGPGPAAGRLTALARTALATAADRVEDAVQDHLRGRWATVLSNGGWELTERDLARTEAAAAFDPRHAVPGATVAVIAPYRLHTAGDHTYLRGHQSPGLLPDDLTAALDDGAEVTLPDDETVLTAVRALGATGGLRLTPRPANPKDGAP